MTNIYKDPMTSQKAAMVKLHKWIVKDSVTTNLTASPLYADVRRLLQQGQAWQKLSILPQHLELIRELPTNWQVVIMQHSPCR